MLVTVGISQWRPAYQVSARVFDRAYLVAFTAVRLLLFALIFLVLRLPVRGDVVGYYVPEVLARLHGGVPYRDFASSYAPLNSYLNAAVYAVHSSPLALILLAVLAECAAAVVWLRVLRLSVPDGTARLAALLCLINPVSLQFVTVDGQNNALLSLLLGLAVLALVHGRATLAGMWFGAGIAAIKFLSLLFTPSFFAYVGRARWRWAGGAALVIAAVYGYFQAVLHAPVLEVFGREGKIKSASGFPYLVEALTGHDFGLRLWDTLLLLLLAALVLQSMRLATRANAGGLPFRVRGLMASSAGLMLMLMAFSKKTWPTYTVIVLFPIAIAVASHVGRSGARRCTVWLFGVFSLIAVTAQSVWASVLNQAPAPQLHQAMLMGDGAALVFYALELILFALYLWLIVLCLREELAAGQAPAIADGV